MKVFEFTTHVTIDDDERFLHNRTGFGYMVYDIAKSISKKELVTLFCANIMHNGRRRDNLLIEEWNWILFLFGIKFRYLFKAISYLYRFKPSFSSSIRVLYAYLLCGFLEKKIKNFDIVHIHGCSFYSEAIIDVCQRMSVPFVVTLHGLNSFNDAIDTEKSMANYERYFLRKAYDNKYPLSFISGGDIKKVINYLGLESQPENFYHISNGCDVVKRNSFIDIRKKIGIDKDTFLFLFVGNITNNKNQIAVAKAYSYLPPLIQQNTKVLFCGNICDEGKLIKFINDNNLSDQLIICGFVPKEEICSYYNSANATILTSYSEGFGLSIIEGFVYGKPNLTYNDLSAVPDIFNKDVMMAIERKGEDELAKAMQSMIGKKWDKNVIESYSLNFSLDQMANRYIELFHIISKINEPT